MSRATMLGHKPQIPMSSSYHQITSSLSSIRRNTLFLVWLLVFVACYRTDIVVGKSFTSSKTQSSHHFNGLLEISGGSHRRFRNQLKRNLRGARCIQHHVPQTWWHYEWCIDSHVRQYHPYNPLYPEEAASEVLLGTTTRKQNTKLIVEPTEDYAKLNDPDVRGYYAIQHYMDGDTCSDVSSEEFPVEYSTKEKARSVRLRFKCCIFRTNETYVEGVDEPSTCEYVMTVCSPVACGLVQRDALVLAAPSVVSTEERHVLKQTVKDMFYHAYEGYLAYAYPMAALKPLSCEGDTFELGRIPLLTLIDALDTLAVLGDAAEFQRASNIVISSATFDLDTEVSLFETTIRVLGGLLSAHLLAKDPELALFPDYDDALLHLAIDLGDRLLPAFNTDTGIPFGTVNLRHGVPNGETPIASTAGAGSLSLEFTMLSVLTQDPKYAQASRGAVRALYQRRSRLGLLGKHIHAHSGDWTESLSGPGSNSDSFYEYLLKMYTLYGDMESLQMYLDTAEAVETYNLHGDWYTDVSMWSGCHPSNGEVVMEGLTCFWPEMQVMLGDLPQATRSVNAYLRVWRDYGFIPEQFLVLSWRPKKGSGAHYQLRPELLESVFYLHQATGDNTWLRAGAHAVHSLQKHCKTNCGYAELSDVTTKSQADVMPSFFLSETTKYLYLLFDQDNFVRHRGYSFTTEAHVFPPLSYNLVKPMLDASTLPNAFKDMNRTIDWDELNHLQCPKPSLQDRLSYDIKYVGTVERETEKCRRPTSPLPVSKSKDHSTETMNIDWNGHEIPSWLRDMNFDLEKMLNEEVVDTIQRIDSQVDHLGIFLLDRMDGVMRVTRENREDWLEISGLWDLNHVLVGWRPEKEGTASFAVFHLPDTTEERIISQRCRLVVSRASGGKEGERENLIDVSCAAASFGRTNMSSTFSSGRVGIVVGEPRDLCTGPEPEQVQGKLVVVNRGDCLFEEKARRAYEAGAVGVLVVNVNLDSQHRVLVMGDGGPNGDDRHRDELVAAMLSLVDGDAVIDQINRQPNALEAELVVDVSTDTEDALYPYVDGSSDVMDIVGPEWGVRLSPDPNILDNFVISIISQET